MGSTTFELLGLTYSIDLNQMIKFNYDKYVNNIIKSTEHWHKTYLTALGKITGIKTFILSKLNLRFLTLPYHGDKIKHKQITKPLNQSGSQHGRFKPIQTLS